MKFPMPKNQKQLKGFLGVTNVYNRFTTKYAEATQPLHELLKKGRQVFLDNRAIGLPSESQEFICGCCNFKISTTEPEVLHTV